MDDSKETTDTLGSLVVKMLKADGYFERLAEWNSNLPMFLNSIRDIFPSKMNSQKKY